MNPTTRPTPAERAHVLAFEASLKRDGESGARLANVGRLTVNVAALVVRFRAEIAPGVDTLLAVEMMAGVGTTAHWAGLAARAGCATPGPEDRARVLLCLRSNCEGYRG